MDDSKYIEVYVCKNCRNRWSSDNAIEKTIWCSFFYLTWYMQWWNSINIYQYRVSQAT